MLEKAGLARVLRTRRVRAIAEKHYGDTYRDAKLTSKQFSRREELSEKKPASLLQRTIGKYEEPYQEKIAKTLLFLLKFSGASPNRRRRSSPGS